MRKFFWTSMFLLHATIAGAQEANTQKNWDFSANTAVFSVRPGEEHASYGDDWYFSGRYSVGFGRYWTEHFKTEIELATSHEGSHYLDRFNGPTGAPATLPYNIESFHRLDQGSIRVVWQFAKNAWIHPFVSGGLVVERDRERVRVPAVYAYPPGRSTGPMVFTPERTSTPSTHYRAGATVGAGGKFYVSQSAFFNTGLIATYTNPAATLSLLAGFGVDF